jgi:hypothetical protein
MNIAYSVHKNSNVLFMKYDHEPNVKTHTQTHTFTRTHTLPTPDLEGNSEFSSVINKE